MEKRVEFLSLKHRVEFSTVAAAVKFSGLDRQR